MRRKFIANHAVAIALLSRVAEISVDDWLIDRLGLGI